MWLVVILLVVVLIIWGPGKLPEMGAGIGRAIREFRHATSEVRDQVNMTVQAPIGGSGATPAAAQEAQPVAQPATDGSTAVD
jgi:sec-independent protein translocase protein TatA